MAEKDNTALIKDALHDMYKEATLPQGTVQAGQGKDDASIISTASGAGTSTGTGAGPQQGAVTAAEKDSVVAGTGISHRDNDDAHTDVPHTDALTTPTTADPRYRSDGAAQGSDMAAAQPAPVVGATNLGNRNDGIDARRDSAVGSRNEISPEHHHHHHAVDDDEHKHEHHVLKHANGPSAPAKQTGGIDYGNTTTTLGASLPDNGPRRHSLALFPHRGHIDSTISAAQLSKKWSLTMGGFGLKLPRQQSNAVNEELNRDGSVSMQGGQGRVRRGIGSISSTVKRGSVDATASARDKTKKWSLSDGDFGLKWPRQKESRADGDAVKRDGVVSAQLGSGNNAALERQNARGIGSISSSVKRGSVDASASQHDKYRKWSLKHADLGLKWPRRGSNLQD